MLRLDAGVPYRIRTGVAAVRGHLNGEIGVRCCPALYSNSLETIDILSAIIHIDP
jgi:hypothetical protein